MYPVNNVSDVLLLLLLLLLLLCGMFDLLVVVYSAPTEVTPSPSSAAQRRAQRRVTRVDNRYHSGLSDRHLLTIFLFCYSPAFSWHPVDINLLMCFKKFLPVCTYLEHKIVIVMLYVDGVV